VYSKTSAIDVLPTLLQMNGKDIPDWVEGAVLPPYAQTSPDPDRRLYAMVAKDNDPKAPLEHASIMYLKGQYKLTHYFGYGRLERGGERVELYDIEADPEELDDLYQSQKEIAGELLGNLQK
jgi:arylsulfatase A-like enzyme